MECGDIRVSAQLEALPRCLFWLLVTSTRTHRGGVYVFPRHFLFPAYVSLVAKKISLGTYLQTHRTGSIRRWPLVVRCKFWPDVVLYWRNLIKVVNNVRRGQGTFKVALKTLVESGDPEVVLI
jgi:hypothetical protein